MPIEAAEFFDPAENLVPGRSAMALTSEKTADMHRRE
jgi:hypothetical protein